MLLSPRPTTLLPSTTMMGGYNPVNNHINERQNYVPHGNIKQSPRQATFDMSATTIIPNSSVQNQSPRRPSSRRSTSGRTSTPDLPRAESATSIRSRGSTSSMKRTMSRDSTSSMKRTMSRDSTTSKKAPRQFIVKSKASRSRPNSTTQLARTPSYAKTVGLLSMTRAEATAWEEQKAQAATHSAAMKAPQSVGHNVRQRVLSVTNSGDIATPPIRRSMSDGNGQRFRRSSSDTSNPSPLPRARRSSNLSREADLETAVMEADEVPIEDDSEESEEEERLEMPIRRPLLEEPEVPLRRLSERSPPVPPTLQLRRSNPTGVTSSPIANISPRDTSTTRIRPTATSPRSSGPVPLTALSPRAISGLSAFANTTNPPHFAPLTHPGPSPAAPPYLTTTSAVIKDLPYATPTVGSPSSLKERLTLLQHGQLNFEDPSSQPETTNSDDSNSPEKNFANQRNKSISLENTRYALSPEAHNMIRRLSNGPPGSIRRPSSPSPPSMPSGWTRSDKITRTMQKQVIFRDLELEAEQQPGIFSPMIARPDSRSDYFNVPISSPGTGNEFNEDPFLNTTPQLNQLELRRINKELNNVKKFSDPVADALQRLAERKGIASPILSASNPSKLDSKLSLSSSWMKRLSPERRDSSPEVSMRKNSLPSKLRETLSDPLHTETHQDTQDGGVKVFDGEQESKLREVTRQLWFSWPERPGEAAESEAGEDQGIEEPETTASASMTASESVEARSVSPTEVRSISPSLRRSLGSGLKQTWGSALALAGLK